jgi:XRE family transcriptional regulator, fatty acid utilization regulator
MPPHRREPSAVAFGREVRRLRHLRGLTLEQLAERCGLTPNYIGSIEGGSRDPSVSTIHALAASLDVASGELLGEAPEISPVVLEVGQLFDAVPAAQQVGILAILRATARMGRRGPKAE